MTNNGKIPNFITFTRELENYKWYKPLLTLIVSVLIFLVFVAILALIFKDAPGMEVMDVSTNAYETTNATSIEGIVQILFLIVMIPSLFIATKITGDRPFSTYLTSREKWNWGVFFKSFIVGAIIMFLMSILPTILGGVQINIQFTLLTFILAIILVPLQCFAEELIFRGLFMQTIGGWFKIPVLAIILQSAIFMLGHPYNILGQLSTLIFGIVCGIIAWQMDGIEATSGLHSSNNLLVFLTIGIFSTGPINSNPTLAATLLDLAVVLISAAVILGLYKKTNWLNTK